MILNISNHESTVIERGIYYFALSDYPNITTAELKAVVEFIQYEELYHRQTEIVCEDDTILAIISNALAHTETIENFLIPNESDFVYHATSLNATKRILSGGRLLSATKVYGKTVEELAYEKRDSTWNDPADYFEYIMFCWGDNMTGDYVVLSENFPSEENLVKGNFNPGVRFYFRYNDIIRHSGHVLDGYHAIKVKDEILLSEYLHACIVPEQYKVELDNLILPELTSKVHYLSQTGISLSDWNDKVYDFVSHL
jgi:hypothetical protein